MKSPVSLAAGICVTALAAILALAVLLPPERTEANDQFVIEAAGMSIRVKGDPEAFERHAGQILTRIETIDPSLIRPGIGLWAEPEDTKPYLPGKPQLVLVGRVVAVERSPGGY